MSVVEVEYWEIGKAGGTDEPAAYYLGTLSHGQTMNVAAKYDDYANLTSANFLIVPNSQSTSGSGYPHGYISWEAPWDAYHYDSNTASFSAPSVSYNPANGNLSFSCTVSCGGQAYVYNSAVGTGTKVLSTAPSNTAGISAKVYLVPKIESL